MVGCHGIDVISIELFFYLLRLRSDFKLIDIDRSAYYWPQIILKAFSPKRIKKNEKLVDCNAFPSFTAKNGKNDRKLFQSLY